MLAWRKRYVAALPGVPSEARAMFEQAVVPRLLEVHPGGRPLVFHQLQTFGVPEADVDARVADLFRRRGNLRYGLLAAPLGVTITLTMLGHATGRHESRPSRAFARVVDAIRERLADSLYAEGEETMESVVGRELEARGLMLAVAESCTGGLIGHRLTQVPGSSAYVDRGVIVYSNEAKQDLLGVPAGTLRRHGAVSAETAAAMARGMRTRSRADVALSVTGIAGPGGGTDRKPVGLVYIGLDARPGNGNRKPVAATREHRFHGPREVVKLRASQAALDLLRRWLQGHRLQP
jgi:nicotinamide-nucleotide amidase